MYRKIYSLLQYAFCSIDFSVQVDNLVCLQQQHGDFEPKYIWDRVR